MPKLDAMCDTREFVKRNDKTYETKSLEECKSSLFCMQNVMLVTCMLSKSVER